MSKTLLQTHFEWLLSQARRMDKEAWANGIPNVALEAWRGFSKTVEMVCEGTEAREKELANIHAARAELIEALGMAVTDLDAMIAAADRDEVWHVNAGTRARFEKARAALARSGAV